MKVHFASGTHPFPHPWVTVDANPAMTPHILADLRADLPPELQDIEQAYVGHFIEHLTPDEGVKFLAGVRSKMVGGGRIMVVGPDVQRCTQWLLQGAMGAQLYVQTRATVPLSDDPGEHVWDTYEAAVAALLEDAGWTHVTGFNVETMATEHPDWPCINNSGWQYGLVAS